MDALQLQGLDAMAIGGHDWKLGARWVVDHLVQAQAPVLAANLWCGGQQPFPGEKVVTVGGKRLAFVGLALGEPGDDCEIRDPVSALDNALAGLDQVDLTIGLVPALDDRQLAMVLGPDHAGLDLVIDARGFHSHHQPQQRGSAWVYGAGSRGKQLGVMELQWVPGGAGWAPQGQVEAAQSKIERLEERLTTQQNRLSIEQDPDARARLERAIESFQAQITRQRAELAALAEGPARNRIDNREIQLPKSLPEDPETKALVDATLQAIRAQTASPTRMLPHRIEGNGRWAGSDTCVACHQAEHTQWTGTAHAHAWSTLVAEKRESDQACFSCHATAVRQEDGPQDPQEVGAFRDVQCEACHGPSRAHVEDPAEVKPLRTPGPEVCVRCHDGEQDGGRFDYPTYLPKVRHGGGG